MVYGFVLAFKLIALLYRVIEQSSMDILLLDHEKPTGDSKHVKAWRHYFVANELAEIQSGFRMISPDTTFIWFIFFWEGIQWKTKCLSEPSI